MAQRRSIILDDSEVIMVIGKDVISQVDENRGEMTRSEFVNFLIQSQLKACERSQDYVDKEEFHRFARGITELFRSFLELSLSHGLGMAKQPQDDNFEELSQQLQALDTHGEEVEGI